VTQRSPDRDSYFPVIEKKYGEPMSYWFERMATVADRKYPEQIAYLRENYGFSQAHANALVLYCRGSKSARRFNSLEEYLADADDVKRKTVTNIFKAITAKHPKMQLVIAWNHPMLKLDDKYIFGVSVHAKHILIAPWGDGVIAAFTDRLEGYEVNKKTIKIPVDWKIDKQLLLDMVAMQLSQING
jgi:uncharacterized protein YdhG (YjbR/CyaY superfamily)